MHDVRDQGFIIYLVFRNNWKESYIVREVLFSTLFKE